MIEKMNKYAYLVYHKEYDAFLKRLRSLGVVHVNQLKVHEHPDIQKLNSEDKRIITHLKYLDNLILSEEKKSEKKKSSKESVSQTNEKPLLSRQKCGQLLGRIEELQDELSSIQASIALKEKEIDIIADWGDFSYDSLDRFLEAGYKVHFYTCPESHFNEKWEEKYDVIVINTKKSIVHFIVLTKSDYILSIDADRAKLPLKDYRQLCEAIEQDNNEKQMIEAELLEIARNDYKSLHSLHMEIENESAWNKIKIQTERQAGNKVMLLEGWVPDSKAAGLEQSLNDEGYYYQKLEITDEDSIPVKLKNNMFSRLFEPIVALYDFPNYRALDLTPFLAPFYMLFFGLCLGDAGYGLLIVIGALFARTKVKKSMKPLMSLVALLGLSTVICGAIGGTLFGIPLLDMDWAWLSSYKKYMLNSDNLFNLALILGAVQILFAWMVKAYGLIRRYGWAYSLDTFGWLILAIGGGSLYLASSVLSPDMARYMTYAVFGVAGILIFLLNNPKRNPLINIGEGLWNTFNMVTGVLGDLLSYMRLFAVGLCSGVLGFVFNELAMQFSSGLPPVVSQLVMVVILLFGHSINIFIACLGAFVHPLRLTFVEFYKNAGFEGGGRYYNPFRNITEEK